MKVKDNVLLLAIHNYNKNLVQLLHILTWIIVNCRFVGRQTKHFLSFIYASIVGKSISSLVIRFVWAQWRQTASVTAVSWLRTKWVLLGELFSFLLLLLVLVLPETRTIWITISPTKPEKVTPLLLNRTQHLDNK